MIILPSINSEKKLFNRLFISEEKDPNLIRRYSASNFVIPKVVALISLFNFLYLFCKLDLYCIAFIIYIALPRR